MYHIGVDQHKHFSQVAVLKDRGEAEHYRLYHRDKERVKEFFASFKERCSVTMEATGNWYWLYDLLEELKLEVKLAHPLKTRIIAEARIKTDTIDAKTLAYLGRAELVAEAWCAPGPVREQRQLLRYRQSLVRIRTALKCKIHFLLDQQGIVPPALSDLFGKKGMEYLKGLNLAGNYQKSLTGYLELIEHLNEEIKSVSADIKKQLQQDARAELLVTVPGIGTILAYLLLAEIGEIRRFFTQDKLCAYAGLVPSTHQTGKTCYHGRITKQGNKYIRWAMIEAAQRAVCRDPALNGFYHKLRRKKGAGKARVAVARKLLTAVYQVLKKSVPYKMNCLTLTNLGKPAMGTGHHE